MWFRGKFPPCSPFSYVYDNQMQPIIFTTLCPLLRIFSLQLMANDRSKMMQVLTVSVLLLCTVSAVDYSDCATNFTILEQALFQTGDNLFELNRVFHPPSFLTTTFIRVNYSFIDEQNDTCPGVTYIWAVGTVLFLQPPTLFQLNSLFFYYLNNDLNTLSLQLPIECIKLVNVTDGVCSCKKASQLLDILTRQVNKIFVANNCTVEYGL